MQSEGSQNPGRACAPQVRTYGSVLFNDCIARAPPSLHARKGHAATTAPGRRPLHAVLYGHHLCL